MTKPDKQRFVIVIEGMDEPRWPLAIRLRLMLKRILRGLHLRCISIEPHRPEPIKSDTIPPYRGPQ